MFFFRNEGDEARGILRHLTEERREQIISLSKKPDLYERLSAAIAPSIYENEDVKKGILLQVSLERNSQLLSNSTLTGIIH